MTVHVKGGWHSGIMVWGLGQPGCQPLEAMTVFLDVQSGAKRDGL